MTNKTAKQITKNKLHFRNESIYLENVIPKKKKKLKQNKMKEHKNEMFRKKQNFSEIKVKC